MRLSIRPIAIDRLRAARVLRDTAELLAACVPFLLGWLARLGWRLLLLVWVIVQWIVGAALAGWDFGGRCLYSK
jgi:hypothetical protein